MWVVSIWSGLITSLAVLTVIIYVIIMSIYVSGFGVYSCGLCQYVLGGLDGDGHNNNHNKNNDNNNFNNNYTNNNNIWSGLCPWRS